MIVSKWVYSIQIIIDLLIIEYKINIYTLHDIINELEHHNF